ncbi:MAG: exodeoxyribonuclease VII small subunit [Gomphosphaeria aponina SAG 52.96 = DSM 107014]|uniref:Exodeoxyribonuclease 7 small subunit n=1 Tax=Gomphosphaeria aponina SAG 52.96 = DSM 107014 TaxID=1521640 RepID=A0A941JR49_9CHRO|nr:exodeoxyribonuclease VII small subunit [Gomphosphaeria aponina SAG 52.96 = DSM 107014]
MKNPQKFEAKIALIEEIIKKIETGELPLEKVFSEYEKAGKLLQECESFLEQGKERMNLVIETLTAGETEF